MDTLLLPYHEETLCFGPETRLIGTVTLPSEHLPPPGSRPGLILLNAGMLPRIGPHRLNVELARTAAAQGFTAIRFDLPGLGDSGFTGSRLSHEEQTHIAIADAMSTLGSTAFAPRTFLIAGLCSGADAGFQMAQHDTRVRGLFMIEPYYFPNRLSATFRALRRLREYGLRRGLVRICQKLDLAPPLHASIEACALPSGPPEEDVRSAPSPQRFAHDLNILLQRGVDIQLIYANTLMGSYDLRHHRRHIFDQLGNPSHFHVEMVRHTDHVFTRIESRRHLIRGMAAWLQRFCATPANSVPP